MDSPLIDLNALRAIEDIKSRSWVLRKAVWDYMKLLSAQSQMIPSVEGYDLDQQRLNSEADHELESILLNANQWYKAVSSSSIPREFRKSIKQVINKDLQRTIVCLRDIREHWEQTRKYFESNDLVVPDNQSKVIWFKKTYPNAHPWSSGMSIGIGYYIAGPEVLNLHNLLLQVDGVTGILGIE